MCKTRFIAYFTEDNTYNKPTTIRAKTFFNQSGATETRAELTCFSALVAGCMFSRAQ